jgi:DNA/RNA-binding domain of Phe-tRNA-synthetase-like protein
VQPSSEHDIHVEEAVWERFPGMALVVVVGRGIANDRAHAEIQRRWEQAWEAARSASRYGAAQNHPRIKPWRQALSAIGLSGQKHPSSIEALLRRAMKGQPFTVNPLVDLYNSVSLQHLVPIGGFDIGASGEIIELRLTRSGDHFLPLDGTDRVPVSAGEVCYATGSRVLTRHFVWKQSRDRSITRETEHALLVAEILGDVAGSDPSILNLVRRDLTHGLRLLGGSVHSNVVQRPIPN